MILNGAHLPLLSIDAASSGTETTIPGDALPEGQKECSLLHLVSTMARFGAFEKKWSRRWLAILIGRGDLDFSCIPRSRFGSIDVEWAEVTLTLTLTLIGSLDVEWAEVTSIFSLHLRLCA